MKFGQWFEKASEICIELCGIKTDNITAEMALNYFNNGMTAQEAGSMFAWLLSN